MTKELFRGPQGVFITQWFLVETYDHKQELYAIHDLIHIRGPAIQMN